MLFLEKKNIFKCLVAFQKMLWQNIFQCLVMLLKIIQKTHFLLVPHIFSASKQIYNTISQQINTETKPNQKKFIKSGQIHQNPTISQLQSQCDRCHLGAILGWNLDEVEGVIQALGSPTISLGAIRSLCRTTKSKGFGFAGDLSRCDLGAIRSLCQTAKLKGAKSKGSRLWVRSLSGCDLSLSLCVSSEMV